MSILLVPIIMIFGLISCSAKFVVDVSSYSVGLNDKKKIFIVPADKNKNITDVEFVEYASYVAKALSRNGFVIVDNLNEADQVVFLGYEISDPQSYIVNIPIWGPTELLHLTRLAI